MCTLIERDLMLLKGNVFMKRRQFHKTMVAASTAPLLILSCDDSPQFNQNKTALSGCQLPSHLAGMTLQELREDYRHRLFDRYLPFWDNGAIDKSGAIFCNLNDDGTVAEDKIFIWYQARALWVYSFLYNNFGKDNRYLDIANRVRSFLVKSMYAGNGEWYAWVKRDGTILAQPNTSTFDQLIVATGLAEYFKATGDNEAFNQAMVTFHSAESKYDDPLYEGSQNWGGYPDTLSRKGIRDLGHHMLVVHMLTQLLSFHHDHVLEESAVKNVEIIMGKFRNQDYGIINENLHHDYSRIQGFEDYMYIGHSLETMWMVMFEALRIKDKALFDTCKNIIRRNLELCWDYIFEGYPGDGHFYVFDGPSRTREKMYNEKSMWSHTEVMIATLHCIEYTGESWARDFYDRAHRYAIEKFDTPYGVWRQGVNRFGESRDRDVNRIMGITNTRKCNFHMPRAYLYNLLSLDRMIKNKGNLTSFTT